MTTEQMKTTLSKLPGWIDDATVLINDWSFLVNNMPVAGEFLERTKFIRDNLVRAKSYIEMKLSQAGVS